MKFGKEFRTHLEETLPEWRDKFLCYKPLKKLLKNLPPPVDHHPAFAGDPANIEDGADGNPPDHRPLVDLQEWFVGILNDELEKFNDFYVDKEEDFIIRFQELKERIERAKESNKDGAFSSETEFSEQMMEIRKDFVTIHGEMVLLKNYSSLNFAGLVKILKKYDKRTGGLLRLPFTQLALHQPFFTTEPLTRLVRECEANLELLFPLEAEVIESTTAIDNQSSNSQSSADMQTEPSATLGEETMDVYRSTLAAMRAIRGLQRASSTYNPLSLSSFYARQDDESTGAVTAENSAANSPATLPNTNDTEDEDAHSG
ncbi:SPX domain-containing protein 4 [Punica granatum]|uniref:SPX domain-containing protein n=2 Tax=Punica granatum TaxID=22663 RepID=A0A218VVQ9_PUNGR|nr:SPX domain-containing protein 4 [Punica granatum]OWM64565.1 hypothetical protein CDL15_Pgr020532 [Punica granatum]PKI47903.1 hypothetical protein CRG98_031687 [Punica granatum]